MDNHSHETGEPLLTPAAVAEILGVSTRQVLRLSIKQVRLGHHTIRYRRADVQAFLERQTSSE